VLDFDGNELNARLSAKHPTDCKPSIKLKNSSQISFSLISAFPSLTAFRPHDEFVRSLQIQRYYSSVKIPLLRLHKGH
jgi:hypothetical protein